MSDLDLNLLTALDALLSERSVSAAARRLRLSPSAMSRTLARLRTVMNDPILVPAGRAMVATPHAEAIAARVRGLNDDILSVLRPADSIDPRALKRDFTIRANEAFVLLQAARLTAAVAAEAPGVRLCFAPKPDKSIGALRDGSVDLDIGVISGDGGELRAQTLYRDRFVGVARAGHPLLRNITPEVYAACGHVTASRKGKFSGPVDAGLAALGLTRDIRLGVPGFPAVLAVTAASDLIGLVPGSFCDGPLASGTAAFDLPVETAGIVISQIWHPRLDADPGHRWLRGVIFNAFH